MSNYLNEGLAVSPDYRVMSVVLAANATISRPRGSVICRKEADDGTLDIYGVPGYTVPFGVLLDAVQADAVATPTANILVSGVVKAELCGKQDSGAWKNLEKSAYADDPDGGDNLLIRAMRDYGIIAV